MEIRDEESKEQTNKELDQSSQNEPKLIEKDAPIQVVDQQSKTGSLRSSFPSHQTLSPQSDEQQPS